MNENIYGAFSYLLVLVIIISSTKVFGLLSKRVNMPQVVGALVAGVIVGPSCLDLVQMSDGDFLSKTAEIGVIMLMFSAGIGTDFSELKKTGLASVIVALIGVIVPLFGGALTYSLFMGRDIWSLDSIFVGVVLMATSVSITVETLRELGKLQTRMGTAILGAAIIDDIIGIIVLTLVTSMQNPKLNPWESIIKILLFFVFVAVCAAGVKLLSMIPRKYYAGKHRIVIFGLAFALLMSYCAETFFGVADITGAYFAGLILCNYASREYIDEKVNVASYLFFSPVFFASIGIKTVLSGMDGQIIMFSVVLLLVAIASKIIGCGIGAKLCRFKNREALAIGIGMVSRGEVALIVLQKGVAAGIIDNSLFPAIVLVVVVTTIITPVLLKLVLGGSRKKHAEKKTAVPKKPEKLRAGV